MLSPTCAKPDALAQTRLATGASARRRPGFARHWLSALRMSDMRVPHFGHVLRACCKYLEPLHDGPRFLRRPRWSLPEPIERDVMADRRPIFGPKGARAQIGYVEANEAFDLSGRLRCIYNAETGNLHDTNSGQIVGHVSLDGNFVGASWLAQELFGQREGGKADADANIVEMPDGSSPNSVSSSSEEGEHAATAAPETGDPSAPDDQEYALLERAIGMIRSATEK